MSNLEKILARMMNENDFAEAVFANAAQALAEYNLSADEIEKFNSISRADFEAFASASPEERKSFALNNNQLWGDYFMVDPLH